MATSSDESYGAGIDDEDLLEAFSQPSQTLPEHPRHRSQSSGASADENEDDDDEDERARKKRKYRIQAGDKEVPAGQVIGATQAEALPDSSPYRIRGPIYKKARIEPPSPAPAPVVAVQSTTASHHVGLPQPKAAPLPKSSFVRTASGISIKDDEAFARELQDLPDDAFSSDDEFAQPREEPVPTRMISTGSSFSRPRSPQGVRQRGAAAPSATQMRQTTLFGGRATATVTASQTRNVHAYRVDKPVELPTHHKLNEDKLATWIYPTNLGAQRDYQFSIVSKGLFSNLLVALPTGLGKTFIAATVMYNYFRWTRDAQIIFVAPTKPLVAQQVDACFNIVGLPRSATTMLTGDQVPALRAEEWAEKRVFFMTPQTLMNDLSTGIADPKKIVLLVVDEAHRATGDYAYNKVVQFMRRFNNSFRILALTATPGASLEAVQEVIDGLGISKVEIRTELSIDIQPYTHTRNTEIVLLDPSDETIMIKELLTSTLQPLANQLCAQNAYYSNDPMTYNAFQLMQARKKWMAEKGRNASMGLKGMVNSLFSVLSSVAHSIKLLNFHGIGPFFSSLQDFQNEVQDGKGGKYKKQITENADFRKMMDRIRGWINKPDFVGHPKLTHLCDRVLNHFLDAGEGRLAEGAPPSSTRIIVFAEYRESAEDIARVLNRHGPMIRASVFVGQADSKRSEGMNQVKQQETINKFKNGIFNVIVATSIGEEGLDIGQVDLIVCYDASASPIRMLQRMGRTGRKRAGNIVLLLMRGKEEEKFAQAKDNYEKIQKMISEGVRFTFRHDLSSRIIPKEIQPIVEKREIVIPQENTQDQSLPEPRRRAAKTKKKPAKKFHMPDGVETGFTTATGRALKDRGGVGVKKPEEVVQLADIPALESVLLRPAEMAELAATYQKVSGSDLQEVEMPSLTSHPVAQRSLLLTARVPHGSYTKRCVRLFKKLGESQDVEERLARPFGDDEPDISWSVPDLVDESTLSSKVSKLTGTTASKSVTPRPAKQPRKKQPKKQISAPTHFDSEDETPKAQPKKKKKKQPQTRRALFLSADESPEEHEPSPSSEGEGHDLARSSARSEDDSELGSLRDFLASSSPALLHRHSKKKKDNTHREPTSFSTSTPLSPPAADKEGLSSPGCANRLFFPTQETNDSMPDVEEILGMGKRWARGGEKDAPGLPSDEDDDEDEDERPVAPRARQRRVVEDDSDE